jgi:hypothetical protein
VFPVGTRFWKEFAKGTLRLETRLIEKTSDSEWRMGSFVWRSDSSDAVWTTDGLIDVQQTGWDVPSLDQCHRCHDGELDNFLGFSAIQLGDDAVADLVKKGLLTNAPAKSVDLPWDATTNAAFGALHGNCGHCHSPIGSAHSVGMVLRVNLADLDQTNATQTQIGTTTIDKLTTSYLIGTLHRVKPNTLSDSAIYLRMSSRESGVQMPPIATHKVDTADVNAVAAWINLPPH